MALPRFVIKTLSNGVRIAVVPDPRAVAVTAMVLVNVGSSFEKEKENGISHFLEHVCFKGTARRPSARVLTEEIESLGAVTNAFTDRELTGYYIKGNPTHAATFVDILADIYHHSTFPEAEVEKEKGVIIEEIHMYEDMPQQKVSDVLLSMLYPDHAAGRSILGTKETVRSFSRSDFVAYKNRFYSAANTTIVFSGNITPSDACSLVKKHFGGAKASKRNKRKRVVERQHEPRASVFHKPTDQAHLVLAFRSFPLGHKDLPVARLIATILGRGMSSRLSLLIREELGAAYYVHAGQESYTDHGIFAISAGIDKTRLGEITERIVAECARLKEALVSPEELAKAKEYAAGTFRLSLELTDSLAEFYGGQFALRQKVQTPEQVIASIRKVTVSDIRRVARVLFRAQRTNFAVVGPFASHDIPRGVLKTL